MKEIVPGNSQLTQARWAKGYVNFSNWFLEETICTKVFSSSYGMKGGFQTNGGKQGKDFQSSPGGLLPKTHPFVLRTYLFSPTICSL